MNCGEIGFEEEPEEDGSGGGEEYDDHIGGWRFAAADLQVEYAVRYGPCTFPQIPMPPTLVPDRHYARRHRCHMTQRTTSSV